MNKVKVHCLGPSGTYGHEVAIKIFEKHIDEIIFHRSNVDILFALEADESSNSYAVVPIENSTGGLVTDVITGYWMTEIVGLESNNYRMLKQPIEIIGEYCHQINHTLIAKSSKVKRIFSHQQALLQCTSHIEMLEEEMGFPIEVIATNSTAGSIDMIKKKGDAAICSLFAAREANKRIGLNIIKNCFNDNNKNQTLFHVLTKHPSSSFEPTHSSVLFTLNNCPHALVCALTCISGYDANMHLIHSIPTGNPGKYAFYVEYNEPSGTKIGKKILQALQNAAEKILVLGSFKQIQKGEML